MCLLLNVRKNYPFGYYASSRVRRMMLTGASANIDHSDYQQCVGVSPLYLEPKCIRWPRMYCLLATKFEFTHPVHVALTLGHTIEQTDTQTDTIPSLDAANVTNDIVVLYCIVSLYINYSTCSICLVSLGLYILLVHTVRKKTF